MDLGSLKMKKNLVEWSFNRFPKYMTLPVNINYEPAQKIQNVVFVEAVPRTFNSNIRLVCVSEDALTDILDMLPDIASQRDFMEFLSGRKFPIGAVPVAHRYGGHQYGMWVGQLGDGRAHIIGEYVNRVGKRWQVQLKGLGPTPFSRVFDGRTVLRSSIREMIVSEALHHLGVPTIRTAVVAVSDDTVVRDKFYTGSPQHERASVTLRLSPSWLRFGSFEILAKCGELQVLRQLADFVIQEHFPDIHISDDNRYLRLFSEISQRSLDLVVKWQGLGFTHGLLNTDNMSLLGLSLGFGPFGFIDCYDEGFVANSSDKHGRYAFMKQPDVVMWNIYELAKTFQSLLSLEQQTHLSQIVKTFDAYCKSKILATFLLKIGLKEERWDDDQLLEKLLDMMQRTGADFTATFRQLAELEPSELLNPVKLEEKWSLKRLSSHSSYGVWVEQYRDRIQNESVTISMLGTFELERRRRMLSVNPVYVPRNWLLEEAIDDAESNNYEKVRILLEVLKNPYVTQVEAESRGYSAQPPQWAYAINVSCST